MIAALLAIPLIGALIALLPVMNARRIPLLLVLVTGCELMVALLLVWSVLHTGVAPIGNLFAIDALSALNAAVAALVFFGASLYGVGYFAREEVHGAFTDAHSRRYGALWLVFCATLMISFSAANLGLMWVSLEASTVASAFLIYGRGLSSAVEAMWKYLLICSVGIALALIGTMLTSAAARDVVHGSLNWHDLVVHASSLDPRIMITAFIFILVGFGTKAGLAPMHTWLPDAHSQAPSPVSAVFSAVMLNAALYAIIRYLPIVEAATGNVGRAKALFVLFGVASFLVALFMLPAQKEMKRMLAYSSVEHMGIVAFCIGTGGLGVFAGLLHSVNHAVAKSLAFFAAGRLVQTFNTHDMTKISGAIRTDRLWGTTLFIAVLALAGAVPFSLFVSEFTALRASFANGMIFTSSILLIVLAILFAVLLRRVMGMCLGAGVRVPVERFGRIPDMVVVLVFVALLLIPGLFLPAPLVSLLTAAASIVEAHP